METIKVALTGNPNSGKTTLFNNLTGTHQHVGNYPGVTVEKKEGLIVHQGHQIRFIDLPGTYSLSAYSEDEVVARGVIINEKPDIIVNVVDSSNLERNLYFVTQLMELERPIILAMNMADIVDGEGEIINYLLLAKMLGVKIIPTIGNKNKGTQKILDAIIEIKEKKKENIPVMTDYGNEIQEEITKIQDIAKKDDTLNKKYPSRWLAIKLLEDDENITHLVEDSTQKAPLLQQKENSRRHLKNHFGDEPEVIIADRRYGFVSGVCNQVLERVKENKFSVTDKIDKVVLNRVLGLPIFALVMYGIFKFTFTCSEPVVAWFETLFEWLGSTVSSSLSEGLLQSFVVDGLIGGLGSVLGFFPLIMFMFLAIAFFEDTGYMARAVFIMDRIMTKFGLHGKSFLPLMLATNGCAVPAIMATRTIENKRDRIVTMLVTPFMICGAKLPILALFIAAFFAVENAANFMFLMYVITIVVAFGSSFLLGKTIFKEKPSYLVMELPPYRIPTIKGLLLKMWERGWLYLKKAGTIILLVSVIMWIGFTFPQIDQNDNNLATLNEEEASTFQLEHSYAGRLGHFIEPLIKPIGQDWRSGGIALLAGIAAKEVVVSTFGTIYSMDEVDVEESTPLREAMQKDPAWNPLKALSFLLFSLIYIPCFVSVAVFYRESGNSLKWTSFLVVGTTLLAWLVSFVTYQIGVLLT
ncbi:MAG: ferrous iron transport protein B [Atribacterota bacterium]|nr:ferrous iron transport protein B [Atribacterota bacterium]